MTQSSATNHLVFVGPGAVAGGQALVAICESHGLDDAVRVLDALLNARD
jgi:hypothetical protein